MSLLFLHLIPAYYAGNTLRSRVLIQGRLIFFTILRDPVSRYISEWLHARRKGSWRKATLRCRGQSPSDYEYLPCAYIYDKNISQLSFERFANCPRTLSNNRQARMIASIDDLGCYANLDEWTRPADLGATHFSLSPIQIDLLASAVENLATAFATFGLIEHPVYTQYMYRIHLGLVFRVPFISHENVTRAKLAQEMPGLLPPDWERITLARNQIDEVFLTASRHIFSHRLALLLQADSFLPLRFRFHLRRLQPRLLLTDADLETRVCSYLHRFFMSEIRRRQKINIAA